MLHFCTPWKRQRTEGFLTFSGGYRNVTLGEYGLSHCFISIPPENVQKTLVFWCFQVVEKWDIGLKWIRRHSKMMTLQKKVFFESLFSFVTICHCFILLPSPMSPPKKWKTFPLNSKLWNTFWYLYNASYHKLYHKQMAEAINKLTTYMYFVFVSKCVLDLMLKF